MDHGKPHTIQGVTLDNYGKIEDLTVDAQLLRHIEKAARLSRVIVPAALLNFTSAASSWLRNLLVPFLEGQLDKSIFKTSTVMILQHQGLSIGLLVIACMTYVAAIQRREKQLKRLASFAREFWKGYLCYVVILTAGFSLAYGPIYLLSLLFGIPALYVLYLYSRMGWTFAEAIHLIGKGATFLFTRSPGFSLFAYVSGIGTQVSRTSRGIVAAILASTATVFEFLYVRYILILNGSPALLFSLTQTDLGSFLPPALLMLAFLGFIVGTSLRRLARLLNSRSYAEVRQSDSRRPILFLRSFQNDQVYLPAAYRSFAQRFIDPGGIGSSLEHLIIEETMFLGPVVATGRPEDRFPPFGAARRYIKDEDWQSVVLSMAQGSALILLAVDKTEGVRWEIEQIKRRNLLDKTVFIVPPPRKDEMSMVSMEDLEALLGAKLLPGPVSAGEPIAVVMSQRDIFVYLAQEPDQTSYRLAIRRAVARLLSVPS